MLSPTAEHIAVDISVTLDVVDTVDYLLTNSPLDNLVNYCLTLQPEDLNSAIVQILRRKNKNFFSRFQNEFNLKLQQD